MSFAGSFRRTALPVADWSAGIAALTRLPKSYAEDVRDSIELARRFNAEVIRPIALDLDAAVQDDPSVLPHEFIAEANRWGLFSRWLPKLFGGGGHSFLALDAFVEEISSECVGLANAFGVHYLGVATLASTWNLRLSSRVYGDVVRGERTGTPCLISLAITEPGAGSDAEEVELADRGRSSTWARATPDGGYLLDGRKVFISNGHVATWHMVVACEDRTRPADTAVVLAVRTGAEGFSLGAHENKMGQKACVASELIFDGCPVPPDQVAFDQQVTARMSRPHREITQTALDYVVSSTRAGVGAFATGVAAGAYREAYAYAARKRTARGPLLEEQWVQTHLADMARNAKLARLAYLESACANSMAGLYAVLAEAPLLQLERYLPRRLLAPIARPIVRSRALNRVFRHFLLDRYPAERQRLTSGLGSMAKITGSDFGTLNAHLALDLMGADGLRHDHGMEKRLRDAKLLQIYEGTNQINRVNYFKCSIREDEGIRVFVRDDDPPTEWRDQPPAPVSPAAPRHSEPPAPARRRAAEVAS